MKRKVEYRGCVRNPDRALLSYVHGTSPRVGAVVYYDATRQSDTGFWLVELWTIETMTECSWLVRAEDSFVTTTMQMYQQCDLPAVAKRLGLTEVAE